MTDPGVPEYEVLWRQARRAVQRGQVKLGYKAPTPAAAAAVSELVGRPLEAGVGTTIPVADLADRVSAVFGRDLADVLVQVHREPLVSRSAQDVTDRREWTDGILRSALEAVGLGSAPWAAVWIDQVRRYAKIAPERLAEPARQAAAVLSRVNLTSAAPERWLTRGELAADVGGSLDIGSKTAGLVLRAAALAHGVEVPKSRGEQVRLWERCGVADAFTTVLVRGFPGYPGVVGAPLGALPAAPEGEVVWVCSRPALLGAPGAAPLICLSGGLNPAARELIGRLVAAGKRVLVHADFDAAGLLVLREAVALGAVPWRMTADDYRAGLDRAREWDIDLPALDAPPGATPWDPALGAAMRAGWAVPEEVTVPLLLADLAS